MKPIISALFVAALTLIVPAHAQDEVAESDPLVEVVQIETEQGVIVAQYSGATKISSRTLGANRAATRADPYRCTYSVDLEVERVASLGEKAEARRQMSSRNVTRGLVPGRCGLSSTDKEIAREIELRDRDFERALQNIIRRDRDDVIAEIDAQIGAPVEE